MVKLQLNGALTDEQFAIIVSDPEIEVLEHSSRPYSEVGVGSPAEEMRQPEDVTANAAALS